MQAERRNSTRRASPLQEGQKGIPRTWIEQVTAADMFCVRDLPLQCRALPTELSRGDEDRNLKMCNIHIHTA